MTLPRPSGVILNALVIGVALLAVTTTCQSESVPNPPDPSIEIKELWIDRSDKILEARGPESQVLWRAQVGIGRGGLKTKTAMSDYITPVGDFVVDLVLYKDSQFSKVSPAIVEKYSTDKNFNIFFHDTAGLERLFSNMNSLDFDGYGLPDNAYGSAYIGLDSKDAVTGPKMGYLGATPYWYSIALHGTTNPKNLGRANSGGCVHVDEKTLDWLVKEKKIAPGLKVRIVE